MKMEVKQKLQKNMILMKLKSMNTKIVTQCKNIF